MITAADYKISSSGYPGFSVDKGKYCFTLSCVDDGPGTVEILFIVSIPGTGYFSQTRVLNVDHVNQRLNLKVINGMFAELLKKIESQQDNINVEGGSYF